jgi:small-conductance mechanosensitive channel
MGPYRMSSTTRQLLGRLRSRLRVPALTALGAAAAVVVGRTYGALHGRGLQGVVLALGMAAVFLVFAVSTVRHLANDIDVVLGTRLGSARASFLGLLTAVIGYAITGLIFLGMLSIPVQQLLLGGAITGVILGIAAQQSLGNLAAGLVLLLARPFTVGDYITVHSGALGGPHTGVVLGTGLTYVQFRTECGVLALPNSAILAAGISPGTAPTPETGDGTETS